MRTLLVLARAAALVLLVVVGLRGSGVSADEETPSPWLPPGDYQTSGQLDSDGNLFQVWRRTDAGETAYGDAHLLSVLREGQDQVLEAYDVLRPAAHAESELLTIRRRAEVEELQGSRIAETKGGLDETGLELAQGLVGRLLAVEPRWLEGVRLLEEATRVQREHEYESEGEPQPDTSRALLRNATRALERARQTAPWHLGIVCDLLAAYQLLLPYEVGTDRGANISFLWREVCAQWLGGAPTEEERALGLLCQLSCLFAEGCYPLAAELIDDPLLTEREEIEPLRRALASIGQAKREVAERVSLNGPRGHVDLLTITCPSDPRSTGFAWHRRVYLTYASGSQGPPLPVWFSLSLEGEAGARRWALVGWVGGSRRVLRLYGAQEPDNAAVDTLVKGLIQQTADAQEMR